MATWEYKTVVKPYAELLTDPELNQLGAQGFELVNLVAVSNEVMMLGRRETRTMVHYFFKRPKKA